MFELDAGNVLSDRYRLVEKLGRGGMAEVWLAQDTALGRQVAVKIMLPQFSMDPEFVARFKREAASAANLNSPYIVNVYDFGQDGAVQYMIMEYVAGEDLKRLIKTKGPLPTKSAAKVGSQVCQALAVAHHQDLIHRDIKPQNIMITPQGNAKVMDFGISRAKNSIEQKTQVVLGTAQYVSPEQAQGLPLTSASDIYSLGIVLYESVTGQPPFDGGDAVSVALKQVEQTPVPPSQINPKVDAAFEAIILKALAKNPEDRFSSVQEMGMVLENYANGIRDFSHVAQTTRIPNKATSDQTVAMPVNPTTKMPSTPTGEKPMPASLEKKPKKGVIAGVIIAAFLVVMAFLGFMFSNAMKVNVPDVVGQELDWAVSSIEEAGLTVGTVTEVPSNSVPEGKVVQTDPMAGAMVTRGSSVDIKVSSGASQVEVPDIVGMSESAAKAALDSVGLKGQLSIEETDSSLPKGNVASQSVAAGTMVEPGTVVIYTLSTGSDTVEVPDLTGLDEDAAMRLLEELGLKGLVGSRQASDTVEKGCIISQNPAKDLKVAKDTQVTIVVSTGEAPSTVPAVVGLTQAGARSMLVNAGLVLGSVTEKASNEPKGTVLSQSYSEGEQVAKGTTVNIVISSGPSASNENTSSNTNTQGGGNSNSNSNINDEE